MSTNSTRNSCSFCSLISQANGEDPIGSAIATEQYLIIETPQPWPIEIWVEPEPMQQGVMTAFESGYNKPLEQVKQYRVSHLLKIA